MRWNSILWFLAILFLCAGVIGMMVTMYDAERLESVHRIFLGLTAAGCLTGLLFAHRARKWFNEESRSTHNVTRRDDK